MEPDVIDIYSTYTATLRIVPVANTNTHFPDV